MLTEDLKEEIQRRVKSGKSEVAAVQDIFDDKTAELVHLLDIYSGEPKTWDAEQVAYITHLTAQVTLLRAYIPR